MKRCFHVQFVALFVALSALSAPLMARPSRAGNRPGRQGVTRNQIVPLPASDGALFVELRRLLTDAAPRAFNNDPKRLADLNADIDEFKKRTGIDARQFDTLAVGARVSSPHEGVTKVDHMVAVATGKFDGPSVVTSIRAASAGKLAEQKHGGKTIYVLSLNEPVKLFGLLRLRVRDLGIALLDPGAVAVGEPEAVRAAIDAHAGRGVIDSVLLAAARQPGALIGFAGNVPPSAFKDIDTGLPEVDKSLGSIRRFRGSAGMNAAGFQVSTTLGTDTAQNAQRLGQTIEAVRQVVPALLSMSGERGQLAQTAIKNLAVTTQGSEVLLRLDLAQSELAAIMRVL